MNTNTLKKIPLMIIFITLVANMFAQKTFQPSDLVKKWEDVYSFFWEYSYTGKSVAYELNQKPLSYTDYYLSDTIETFDKSKVNKNTEGKYVIFAYGNIVYEILSLTKNRLILKDFGSIFISITNEDSVLYIDDLYDDDCYYYYLDYGTTLNYEKSTQQTFLKSDIGNKNFVKQSCKYDYYLSDSIETIFDTSKVGKSTSGRYIIERNSKGEVYVLKILKLTNRKMILKEVYPKNSESDNEKIILQAVIR